MSDSRKAGGTIWTETADRSSIERFGFVETSMPRYFFHVHDGEDLRDTEGTELTSLKEVRIQAIIAAGEMLKDRGLEFWDGKEWHMDVVDEHGTSVCHLSFSARA